MQQAAELGFTAADFDRGDCELYPDVNQWMGIWEACRTQWRVVAGMGGAVYVGLDYPAVQLVLDLEVPKPDQRDTWWALRIIEREALEVLNKG